MSIALRSFVEQNLVDKIGIGIRVEHYMERSGKCLAIVLVELSMFVRVCKGRSDSFRRWTSDSESKVGISSVELLLASQSIPTDDRPEVARLGGLHHSDGTNGRMDGHGTAFCSSPAPVAAR